MDTTDLQDIEFDMSDYDQESDNMLEHCPSPPMPFRENQHDRSQIVEPPDIFNDHPFTTHQEIHVPFDNIFFHDAKTYLLKTTASVETNRSGMSLTRLISFLRSTVTSQHILEFHRQCDQLIQLSQYPCLMTDRIHARILYTIYRRLTDSKAIFHTVDGSHWETIGFQNINPETDFRSTGLFSITCLLYFVDSMYLPLAKQIYQFSRQTPHDFPFCCVGINLSGMLIKVLRQSTSRLNMRNSADRQTKNLMSDSVAMNLVGKYFIALYLNFYLTWKNNGHTIEHSQQVLKQLELMLNNRPKLLLTNIDDYFRSQQHEHFTQPIDSSDTLI
jgi:ELMO domain-containing protein